MVDEFSSFARMPKPAFREDVAEIARQALFLHEVAHPGIGFAWTRPIRRRWSATAGCSARR